MTFLGKLQTAIKTAQVRAKASGLKMVDITQCELTGLTEVFGGSQRVGRTRLIAGGAYIQPRRMLWSSGNDAIDRPHVSRAVTPDIDLYFVRDATVGGLGAHLSLDGEIVYAQGPYPEYVKFWFERRITPELWNVTAPAYREMDAAFVITHYNFVWGHWLTEMYPKLFLIEALAKIGVKAPILLPSTAPGYVADIIRSTLPRHEIVTYEPYSESVHVRLALLPHMLNQYYVFHDLLRSSLDRQALATSIQPPAARIYVSRRNLNDEQSYRRMVNQVEIEAIAEELGLQLLSPELMSWPEQVVAFSNAAVVMGEFGSGLHNAILSPAETKVMALNWIVDVQSRIANFKRHDIGYLLPTDGMPRTHSLAPTNQEFTIDPAAFRTRARQVLDAADKSPLRRYEDIPVLRPASRKGLA